MKVGDIIHLMPNLYGFLLTYNKETNIFESENNNNTQRTVKKRKASDSIETPQQVKKLKVEFEPSNATKDGSGYFREFTALCQIIGAESSYDKKTEIIREFLKTFK